MLRSSLLISLILISTAAWAQANRATSNSKALPNSPTLVEVRVIGSIRFAPAELVAAIGLKLGGNATEDELKRAADQLAASGMFSEVSYAYRTAPDGTRVEYKVADTEKLLPIRFDNFVWLPRTELIKELQKREPLFRGELANQGALFERLASDIQALLSERGVTAVVKAFPVSAERGGDILGFNYTVEGVKLPIRSVTIAGASAMMQPILQKTAESLTGRDFSESALQAFIRLDLIPQYLRRGYLRAAFDGVFGQLADPATGAVAVHLAVQEGLRYKLAEVRWSGNSGCNTSDLLKVLKMQIAQPADRVQFEEDLERIQRLYGTRGYLQARLTPVPSFDDAARTVVFEVKVQEGPQYRMGSLSFEGLSETAAAKLRKLWTLKTGEIYDASYPGEFLHSASRQYDLSRIRTMIHQLPHPDSQIVDLVLHFEGS